MKRKKSFSCLYIFVLQRAFFPQATNVYSLIEIVDYFEFERTIQTRKIYSEGKRFSLTIHNAGLFNIESFFSSSITKRKT